jgi:putative membrane protein
MPTVQAGTYLTAAIVNKAGAAADRAIINKPSKHQHMQMQYLLNSVIYALLGIAILVAVFVVIEKLTPRHNLWKEIVENKNVALAVVAGFFMLAMAIIIASAIH